MKNLAKLVVMALVGVALCCPAWSATDTMAKSSSKSNKKMTMKKSSTKTKTGGKMTSSKTMSKTTPGGKMTMSKTKSKTMSKMDKGKPGAKTEVKGYTKKNGQVVKGYTRSKTGASAGDSGKTVHVKGYTKKNGTVVKGYTRKAPAKKTKM